MKSTEPSAENQNDMAGWNVNFFDKFEVRNPDGLVAELPTKKSKLLVAILALNLNSGLDRDLLGELLWPESPSDKQRESLRQCLHAVRKVMGPESIVTELDVCRLSEKLNLETDLDLEHSKTDRVFMPGFDLRILQTIGAIESLEPRKAELGSPVDGFVNLLEWYSSSDPSKMIGLMRENLPLTMGMDWTVQKRLLDTARNTSELKTWQKHFEGLLLMSGGSVAVAERRFREVLNEAEKESDRLLAIQAGVQICLSSLLQSRFEDARAISKLCSQIASRSRSTTLIPTTVHLEGIVFVHSGQVELGVEKLEIAENAYKDYLDSMIMRSLRAYFLAVAGHIEEASRLLEQAESVGKVSGHIFINLSVTTAKSVLYLRRGAPEKALRTINETIYLSEKLCNNHFLVHGLELSAQIHRALGDNAKAENETVRSRKLRTAMDLKENPFDRMVSSVRIDPNAPTAFLARHSASR